MYNVVLTVTLNDRLHNTELPLLASTYEIWSANTSFTVIVLLCNSVIMCNGIIVQLQWRIVIGFINKCTTLEI